MTIQDMKEKKIELGLTNEMIAERSGVPLSTIQKIMSGATRAPRKNTIDAIEDVLLQEERSRKARALRLNAGNAGSGFTYRSSKNPSSMVRESSPAYQPHASSDDSAENVHDPRRKHTIPQGSHYTIDDYYALPDDLRVELIDGQFFEMNAPALIHQKILGELHLLFRECTDTHEGNCEVYLSPCDVRLDRDPYTMVQPDLLVVCSEYDFHAKAFEGAPDLVVEILSPSTRSKDMLLKLYKYLKAGVREYWIIDPEQETVLVYDLSSGKFDPVRYDFNSVIPIGISEGSCSIDFSRIKKALDRSGKRSHRE